MKISNRILNLILVLLLSGTAFAQEIKWGDLQKSKWGSFTPRIISDDSEDLWNDYLHNRENPAGVTKDLWYHESGCNSWLIVTRNTVTHEVKSAELTLDLKGDLS